MSVELKKVGGSPQLFCERNEQVPLDYSDLVTDVFVAATAKLGFDPPPIKDDESLKDYLRRIPQELKEIYKLAKESPIVCQLAYCQVNCSSNRRCCFRISPDYGRNFTSQLAEIATNIAVEKWLSDHPS